jgi:hypothetical protein
MERAMSTEQCDFCLTEIEQGAPDGPWLDASDPDDDAARWCPQAPDHLHDPGLELEILETYVNDTEGHIFGESDWFEPWTDDKGKLFRSLQQEYGACRSMMYRDVKTPVSSAFTAFGVTVPPRTRFRVDTVGWVFAKTMRYEDARPGWTKQQAEYVREVWVQVRNVPASWGWEGAAP